MSTFPDSAAGIAAGLAAREFSSVEVTSAFLDRIDSRDKIYNSFISVTRAYALEQAAAADAAIADGTAGQMTGVPYAHKDIFCTAGTKTTCGSRMLDNFTAPYNATVSERLNAAGMVMLGKTNMDEFAMGSSNETSYYGPVINPWRENTVPGGSSGGSAAAVAARLTPCATATDTGGSIRQPAALCGVSGLKPTYGRVSRYGMIAFASSLDQGGPIACSAHDLALLLNVMAAPDPRDSTSVARPEEDFTAQLDSPIAGRKIGIPRQFVGPNLDPAIATCLEQARAALESQGAQFVELDMPRLDLSIPAYYVISSAECSSNLSRYDGVRFGYRCADPADLDDLYCRSRGEGFGIETKRRILVGTYALSSGYYDAYYRKAQQIRRLIRDEFQSAFETVDYVFGPTSPTTAFPLGQKAQDPVSMYLSDIYTTAVNLAGLPAASVPAGFVDGMPVGLQLIGNYFDEAGLLGVAHQFQTGTDWHAQLPPGLPTEN
jgi:aspartyl-tRNA(Asn)/glutamyl-tRNA(Gln) amidotransferase subunit A